MIYYNIEESFIPYSTNSLRANKHQAAAVFLQARIQGGGGLGPASTPGTEGPAPKAQVPSFQGQKEGTLVSLEWLFNTIQQ